MWSGWQNEENVDDVKNVAGQITAELGRGGEIEKTLRFEQMTGDLCRVQEKMWSWNDKGKEIQGGWEVTKTKQEYGKGLEEEWTKCKKEKRTKQPGEGE